MTDEKKQKATVQPFASGAEIEFGDWRHLVRALKFTLQYKLALLLFFVASLGYGLLYGGVVYILNDYLALLFESLGKNGSQGMDSIIHWSGMIAIMGLGAAVCAYYREMTQNFISARILTDVYNRLFSSLLRQSVQQYDASSTGQTISVALRDVHSISAIAPSALQLVREPLVILPVVASLIVLSPSLTLIGLFGIPLVIAPLMALAKRIKNAVGKTRIEYGKLSDIIIQTIAGIRIVKAYRSEENVQNNYRKVTERIFRHFMKSFRASALGKSVVELITVITLVGVILLGAWLLLKGEITPGSLLTIMLGINIMFRPVKNLAHEYNLLQQHRSGLKRAFDLLDAQPVVKESPTAAPLPRFESAIEFKNVTFGYNPDAPVLTDISFRIDKGESIGIVGPTGAGKSTIINLVSRFYDATSGAIKIDGRNLREITFGSLMDNIALVTQTPYLFNTTVRENILYGRPDATTVDVEAAARAAHIHDEILRLPEGYETSSGERGDLLSGGQRQRISIARAIIKGAPILLLDEATSALDSSSEKFVQDAIDQMLDGCTSLIVAHRLSTLKNCDRIMVINQGRLEAIAPHEELLRVSPTYQLLWKAQQ
ncbi:MAG: ABC transporter ATP-binding protein [Planctomycetota bacterium]